MLTLAAFSGQLDPTTLFLFVLIFLAVWYWLHSHSGLPPGPTPLPVVGNLLTTYKAWKSGRLMAVVKEWRHRYGDLFTVWQGPQAVVIVSDYKILHEMFVKHGDIFSGRIQNFPILQEITSITGKGVINSDGPQWKELRRVTLMSMRDFGLGKKTLDQRVREEAREVVAVMAASQGRPTAWKPLLSQFSSNVICSIILGNRFSYSDPVFQELTMLVNEVVKGPLFFNPINVFRVFRLFPAARKMMNSELRAFKILDSFLSRVVSEHEASFDPSDIKSFVDIYIKTRSESKNAHIYTAANMRRVIMDLFIAGTETSATTMDWLILYMVAHPDIQARCHRDINEVVGQDRMVTSEDRKKLPYIEAVITEVTRHATLTPLGVPHVATADGEIGGYRIPQGTIVMANLMQIHRDPRTWPDPDTFDPGRFLDKEGQYRPPKECYAPFSLGPRVCLGESLARLEIFILFCTLLQNLTFSCSSGQTVDFEGVQGIVSAAKPQPVSAKCR